MTEYELPLLRMFLEKNLPFVSILFSVLQLDFEEKNLEIFFEYESHTFLFLIQRNRKGEESI